MWLDRLSGQITSQQRSSPSLNRSVSQLRRPALPQRVSSWTGLVNGSPEALPQHALEGPRGSLRDLLSPRVGSERRDGTTEALQEVLGLTEKEADDAHRSRAETLQYAQEIDFGERSLDEFVKADDRHGDGNGVETDEGDRAGLQELHDSIQECDKILVSVEKNLLSFQADLSAVSTEMESLQNRSMDLTDRVQRRKAVDVRLSPTIDKLLLPSALVRKIVDGGLDESWTRALRDLEKASDLAKAQPTSLAESKAARDLEPIIEALKDRAVGRIRDHFVSQIKALRLPGVNAQVLQNNALGKFKDAYSFLAQHQPQLEEEIAQAYINTMRWYYLSNFTRYKAALDKMSLCTIDKNDNLAQEDPTKRTTAPSGSRQPKGPFDAFTLGRRIDILRVPDSQALSVHAAEENGTAQFLEVPFRAFNLALVDNASAEFSFMTGFFSKASFHTVTKRFMATFEPTLSLGQSLTRQLIEASTDSLAILTCVRLNQHFAFELQRRRVSPMEGYINGTSMILWPRFQIVMNLQSEALKKATSSLSGRPIGSALGLTSSASTVTSLAPHAVTQRFANFVQGILLLSRDAGDDEPVQRSLSRLRDDFRALVLKLSKSIAEVKKRERFLINNFSLVRTIISDTEGRLAEEMKDAFDTLKALPGAG